MLSSIKKAIPTKWKLSIYYALLKSRGWLDFGNRHNCNICNKSFGKFADFNGRHNVMCPSCFSLERHRLLYEYLNMETDLLVSRKTLLHFAPEKCLYSKLSKNTDLDYITADLMTQFIWLLEVKPDLVMSITDIRFPDNTFDSVICNHVLEHIPDDEKALLEIYRVIKPGGFAILQVPINPDDEHTLEDSSLTREERRIKYGSPDHLRLYGETDYVNRLSNAGFDVRPRSYAEHLDAEKHMIDSNEKIFLCVK